MRVAVIASQVWERRRHKGPAHPWSLTGTSRTLLSLWTSWSEVGSRGGTWSRSWSALWSKSWASLSSESEVDGARGR